jgi:hypothetical protein
MRVCEAGGASEAFFTFLEKRKMEEKGRRGLKELAVLHRLHRMPRKPAWLMGFQRMTLAVTRFNPRQNNPPPCTKPHPTQQPKTQEAPMRGSTSIERLSEHVAAVTFWSARYAPHAQCYSPAELERNLGLGMRALAQPLLLSGWRRVSVFSRKSGHPVSRTLWLPPGSTPPMPNRGRPRFDLFNLLGV